MRPQPVTSPGNAESKINNNGSFTRKKQGNNLKAINKTKLPDELVDAVVKSAKRFVRCQGKVPVVVRQTRYRGGRGVAHRCDLVNIPVLKNPKSKTTAYKAVDGGYIELWINGMATKCNLNHLQHAETLFKIACHEFCHILDYQEGGYIPHRKGSRHDSRPCELAVDNRLYDLRGIANFWGTWKYPSYAETAILNLAIAMEESIKKD